MTSSLKTLIDELVDAWNHHDPPRVQACYTDDCEESDVALRRPQRGSANIRKLMRYYLRAFPDVKVTVDQTVYNGEKAALLWRWTGTHQGRFMNIPATGRSVSVRGATLLTVRGGRIHRLTRVWDVAGLLRDLGLLPEL